MNRRKFLQSLTAGAAALGMPVLAKAARPVGMIPELGMGYGASPALAALPDVMTATEVLRRNAEFFRGLDKIDEDAILAEMLDVLGAPSEWIVKKNNL